MNIKPCRYTKYEVITCLKGTTIQKHCFILYFLEFSDNFSHRVHKTETRENKTNASQMDGRTNLCMTFAPPKHHPPSCLFIEC